MSSEKRLDKGMPKNEESLKFSRKAYSRKGVNAVFFYTVLNALLHIDIELIVVPYADPKVIGGLKEFLRDHSANHHGIDHLSRVVEVPVHDFMRKSQLAIERQLCHNAIILSPCALAALAGMYYDYETVSDAVSDTRRLNKELKAINIAVAERLHAVESKWRKLSRLVKEDLSHQPLLYEIANQKSSKMQAVKKLKKAEARVRALTEENNLMRDRLGETWPQWVRGFHSRPTDTVST